MEFFVVVVVFCFYFVRSGILLLFSLVCFSLTSGKQKENAFLLFPTHCSFCFPCFKKKTQKTKKTQPKTSDRAGFCHFVLRKKKKVGGFLTTGLRRYIVEVAQMLDLFLCLLFAYSLLAAMDRLFVPPPNPPCPVHILVPDPHADPLLPFPNGSR